MILSYHPLIEADDNRLCAGRTPDQADAAAMAGADAVILNQGCYESLYHMARKHCARVFPNYDARFDFSGKIGQIRLFRRHGAPHPPTRIYEDLSDYRIQGPWDRGLPAVFKFDWGGEGETVFRIDKPGDLEACLDRAAEFEGSGQRGFLIQDYVPHGGRSLRVVAIHRSRHAYWRIQDDSTRFGTAVSDGARIEKQVDPELRRTALARIDRLCDRSGINLAGFDLIVPSSPSAPAPLFLEVNYFFGRRGLGGSNAYYALLEEQVRRWIQDTNTGDRPAGKGGPEHGQA